MYVVIYNRKGTDLVSLGNIVKCSWGFFSYFLISCKIRLTCGFWPEEKVFCSPPTKEANNTILKKCSFTKLLKCFYRLTEQVVASSNSIANRLPNAKGSVGS